MNRWFILLAAFLMGLFACHRSPSGGNKAVTTKDTLVYTYNTVKERATDCGKKPDSSCTVAKVTYPVFANQKSLNDTVIGRLLSAYYTGDKPDSSLKQQTHKFIQFYNYDTTRNADHPDMFYTLESSATVVRQDSGLVTIQIDRYTNDGGAHGSDYTGFINWNTKENKRITLEDILVPGYNERLTTIVEKAFRAQEKLSDTASMGSMYAMIKNGKLVLTHNFLVTPVGITFLYNEYEIKPYSEGQTTLPITYTQIKSLLRPNTVLKQYIK